jgi:type VI secretion system secreted protein Hcp
MSFDAYLHFTKASDTGIHPKGEFRPVTNAIALCEHWSFSLENRLKISSITEGAGAGKAEFQEFAILKHIDTSSADLFVACASGAHFHDVELVLLKATGNNQADKSQAKTNVFLKWTFSMLAVERVEWSHAEPVPAEAVTFRFGACKLVYKKQNKEGKLIEAGECSWSQVENDAADKVT